MNALANYGALQEARFMAEILIANPTQENLNRYRKALVYIMSVYECSMDEAAHKVTNLIDAYI